MKIQKDRRSTSIQTATSTRRNSRGLSGEDPATRPAQQGRAATSGSARTRGTGNQPRRMNSARLVRNSRLTAPVTARSPAHNVPVIGPKPAARETATAAMPPKGARGGASTGTCGITGASGRACAASG